MVNCVRRNTAVGALTGALSATRLGHLCQPCGTQQSQLVSEPKSNPGTPAHPAGQTIPWTLKNALVWFEENR